MARASKSQFKPVTLARAKRAMARAIELAKEKPYQGKLKLSIAKGARDMYAVVNTKRRKGYAGRGDATRRGRNHLSAPANRLIA